MSYSHYAVLGIPETANKNEIKRAYRKLALMYHPDVNGGDKFKTKQYMMIREAYETLSAIDPTKVHHQYEHRSRPVAIIVYNNIDSNGDAIFHCIFKNMLHGECTGKNGTISWNFYGMHVGDLRVPKQYLLDNNYHVTFSFTALDGSVAVKAYVFDDPRSGWEILRYKLKKLFK